MKRTKTLDYEGLKKLFNKFNIYTLDTIAVLYEINKQDTPGAFDVIFDKKFEESRDDFEGMNEYPYCTKYENFNLQEVINKLNTLSDLELNYITDLVVNAVNTIEPADEAMKLIPKLVEYEKAYADETIIRLTPLENGMTSESIEKFFAKYGINELELFDQIFKYSSHEKITNIKRIQKEVLESKIKRYKNNPVASLNTLPDLELANIANTNKELDDRELEFLHDLVEDASNYLDCIRDYQEYYEEIMENFDINNYPIGEMKTLLNKIRVDEQSRKDDSEPTNKKTM